MSKSTGKRILLAEDDEFTRTLVAESLKNHGMQVSSVGSVNDALSLIDLKITAP